MPTATEKLLQLYPCCCFCGGTVAADSLDHQPARIVFPDRHRPKGFEFSACRTCNVQTSPDEALVAFFARAVGGHRFPQGRPDKALKSAIQAVQHSFPGLISEITQRVWLNQSGLRRRVLAINANNQQIEASVCRVAAKLALATYHKHYCKAAPATVKINTMWTHNQNPHAVPEVAGLLAKLQVSKHLKQGADWDTQDTFFVRYFADADAFFVVAILHESLALMAQITVAGEIQGWMPWHRVWTVVAGQGIQSLP